MLSVPQSGFVDITLGQFIFTIEHEFTSDGLEWSFDDIQERYTMNSGLRTKIMRALQPMFLGMLVLAGVLGTAWAIIWWYLGESIPQYFVRAGPLLLVLVTLINIGLAGFGYLESRRERRIARDSLDLHRKDIKLKEKPAIIDTIAFTIDPTLKRLDEDQSMLSSRQGNGEYQKLSDIDFIEKEFLQDIPDRYPDLHLDIPAYLAVRNAYGGKRSHVKKQLTEAIPSELDDSIVDVLLTATGSSLDEIGSEGDVYFQRLQEYSEDLAEVALTGSPPRSTKVWISDNAEAIQEALFELRNADIFEEDFDKLEETREDALHENERISENLISAKNSLKDEYNIRESEITRRKEEIK